MSLLGEAVKIRREELGLDQLELGHRVGVGQQTVSSATEWRRGSVARPRWPWREPPDTPSPAAAEPRHEPTCACGSASLVLLDLADRSAAAQTVDLAAVGRAPDARVRGAGRLDTVSQTVLHCTRDVTAVAVEALPELVERCARQRLAAICGNAAI
jgi:hypothetical protein